MSIVTCENCGKLINGDDSRIIPVKTLVVTVRGASYVICPTCSVACSRVIKDSNIFEWQERIDQVRKQDMTPISVKDFYRQKQG